MLQVFLLLSLAFGETAIAKTMEESSVGQIHLSMGTGGSQGRVMANWNEKVAAMYNSLVHDDQIWVDQNCDQGILDKPKYRYGEHTTFLSCRHAASLKMGTFVYYDGSCYLYDKHHSVANLGYKHHRQQGQDKWMYCTFNNYAGGAADKIGNECWDAKTGNCQDNGGSVCNWCGQHNGKQMACCRRGWGGRLCGGVKFGSIAGHQCVVIKQQIGTAQAFEDALTVAMAPESSISAVDLATYGFALLGLGFLVFQGVKTCRKQQYTELVGIEQSL